MAAGPSRPTTTTPPPHPQVRGSNVFFEDLSYLLAALTQARGSGRKCVYVCVGGAGSRHQGPWCHAPCTGGAGHAGIGALGQPGLMSGTEPCYVPLP